MGRGHTHSQRPPGGASPGMTARRRRTGRVLRVGGFVAFLALLVAVPVLAAITGPTSSTSYSFATSPTTDWKNTNQNVAILVTTSEPTATATVHFSIDGGATYSTIPASAAGTRTVEVTVTAEGSHLFRYYASDNGTSTVEAVSTGLTYVNIDKTAPVTTAAPALAGGTGLSPWFNSAVTVTLTATDTLSGVVPGVGTSYRLNDDPNPTVYVNPFTIGTQGSTKLTYRSSDRALNVEATQTAWVNIDETAPTVTAKTTPSRSSGWYNTDVTVALTPTDALSGVAKTQYRVHGTTAWSDAVGDAFTLTTAANKGIFTYDYQAVDKAGNVSSAASIVVNIDPVAPTTHGQDASGKAGKSITLKYKIKDNLSPKAQAISIKIRNSSGEIVKKQSISGTKTINTWYSFKWTPKAKGTYKYYVYAKDLAGNPQKTAGWAKIKVK